MRVKTTPYDIVMAWCAVLCLAQLGAEPLRAVEPILSVRDGVVDSGGNAVLFVDLVAAGERPSAVQLDIRYAPEMLSVQLSAGAAIDGAKQLSMANVASGALRALIAGLNQTTIGDGPILELGIRMRPGTPAGR